MDDDQRTDPTESGISSRRNDSLEDRPIRLCTVTTIGKSIQILYEGRLEYFAAHGFEVTAVCASSELDDAIRARGLRFRAFPLTRAITPFQDIKALVGMIRFFRREKFDIVEVSTPKAALLGSIAAWIARCPCLIHLVQGLAYEGKRGLLGFFLRMSVSVPCRLAHATFSVSRSVRDEIDGRWKGPANRVRVLGVGSVNGVNLRRFAPERRQESRTIREAHRIPVDAVVIGFVGRLVRDKGVEELAEAFRSLREEFPQCPSPSKGEGGGEGKYLGHHERSPLTLPSPLRGEGLPPAHSNPHSPISSMPSKVLLLLVGDYEHRDKPSPATMDFFARDVGVRAVGWQNDVIPFLAAMDIFVLPTYREGLPGVLLEAAAMGLPTVTTDATGARDAMVDGVTGLRVPIGDAVALRDAIARMVRDAAFRESLGRAGREWVCANFEQSKVWERYAEEYRKLMGK